MDAFEAPVDYLHILHDEICGQSSSLATLFATKSMVESVDDTARHSISYIVHNGMPLTYMSMQPVSKALDTMSDSRSHTSIRLVERLVRS